MMMPPATLMRASNSMSVFIEMPEYEKPHHLRQASTQRFGRRLIINPRFHALDRPADRIGSGSRQIDAASLDKRAAIRDAHPDRSTIGLVRHMTLLPKRLVRCEAVRA
jgi:hypothetical protein